MISAALIPPMSQPFILSQDAGFLEQCAELSISIFAQLSSHIQSPDENRQETSATLSNLDIASRILKRLQETYISAQKAIEARASIMDIPAKQSANSEPLHQPSQALVAPRTSKDLANPDVSPGVSYKSGDALKKLMSAINVIETNLPHQSSSDEEKNLPNLDDFLEEIPDAGIASSHQDTPLETIQPTQVPSSPPLPSPAPKYHPPFRPPLTRNQKKAGRRKAKGKR